MGRKLQSYEKLAAGHFLNNARFKIVRSINAGGFGIGYEADQVRGLYRKVFIKEHFPKDYVMRQEGDTTVALWGADADYDWSLNQFLDEGQLLASLPKEKGLVTIFETFEENGTAYMVMEYVDGIDLKSWLKDRRERGLGSPSQSEILEILFPLLDGLTVAHAGITDRETGKKQPIIHRDIASDNIRLRQEDGTPVLLDFGSARPSSNDLVTVAITAVVKRGYAPWELYQDTDKWQGPWSDIYALGALVCEMITGTLPPEGHHRRLSDTHQALAGRKDLLEQGYSGKFLKAVDWALLGEIEERPQSIAEWRAELEPDIEFVPQPKPSRAIWGLVVASILIVATLLFVLFNKPAEQTIVVKPGTEDTAQGTQNLEALFEKAKAGNETDQDNLRDFLQVWKDAKPDIQSPELLESRLASITKVAEKDLNGLGPEFYEELKVQFTKNLEIQDEMTSGLQSASGKESLNERIAEVAELVETYGEVSGTPAAKFADLMNEVRDGIGKRDLKQSGELLEILKSVSSKVQLTILATTLDLVASENIILKAPGEKNWKEKGKIQDVFFTLLNGARAESTLSNSGFGSVIDCTYFTKGLDELCETLCDPDTRDQRIRDTEIDIIVDRVLPRLANFEQSKNVINFQKGIEEDSKTLSKIKDLLGKITDRRNKAQMSFEEVFNLNDFDAISQTLWSDFKESNLSSEDYVKGRLKRDLKFEDASSRIDSSLKMWLSYFRELAKHRSEIGSRLRGKGFIDEEINTGARKFTSLVTDLRADQKGLLLALNFDKELRTTLTNLGELGQDHNLRQNDGPSRCSTVYCYMAVAEGHKIADWRVVKEAAKEAWRNRASLDDRRAGQLLLSGLTRVSEIPMDDRWNHWLEMCKLLQDFLISDPDLDNQIKVIGECFRFIKGNYDAFWPLIETKGANGILGGRPDFTTLLDRHFNMAMEVIPSPVGISVEFFDALYGTDQYGVKEDRRKFLERAEITEAFLRERGFETAEEEIYKDLIYRKIASLEKLLHLAPQGMETTIFLKKLVAECEKGREWEDPYLGILVYYYRKFLEGPKFKIAGNDHEKIEKMVEKLQTEDGVTVEMVNQAKKIAVDLIKKKS